MFKIILWNIFYNIQFYCLTIKDGIQIIFFFYLIEFHKCVRFNFNLNLKKIYYCLMKA